MEVDAIPARDAEELSGSNKLKMASKSVPFSITKFVISSTAIFLGDFQVFSLVIISTYF